MKNKGFKIAALILTLAVTFIAHPFLIVRATTSPAGILTTTLRYNDPDDTSTTSYPISRIITLNFETEQTGYAAFTLDHAITPDQVNIYGATYSAGSSTFNIHFDNTKFIYIEIYFRPNYNVVDIVSWDLYSSDSENHITNIENSTEIIETSISEINRQLNAYLGDVFVQVNRGLTGNTSASFTDFNANGIYMNLSNVSAQRIDLRLNYAIANGNYLAFTIYLHTSTNVTDQTLKNIRLRVRDMKGYITNINTRYVYYQTVLNSDDNKYDVLITLYIPSYLIFEDNNYDYMFWFIIDQISIPSCDLFGFIMRGMVEQLPEENYLNSTPAEADSLIETTEDLNDLEETITGFESLVDEQLTDFQENVNLNDYTFPLHFNSQTFYFMKQTIGNFYNLSDLRPFYIIPIILFIFVKILGG